ncbi:DUF6443 domain-containing protein [Mucilaginibacter sp. 3215]|uniref:DUF6443 domain-containing protein n=1 Tax=Mucilaginibacter sp. 3215 TaxID=3373912 RepID=UPI003D21B154
MKNLIIFKGIMYRGSCIILLTILTLCLLNNGAFGQTPGFVQQDIIKKQAVYTDADIPLLGTADRQVIRSYYDGLGQALQTIAVKSSPTGNDIIQPYTFNALGQQTASYLPYVAVGSSGSYHPSALTTEQAAFYSNGLGDKVADDPNPYLQVFYADDPSQKLILAGKVGNGYQIGQRTKGLNYRSNNSGDGNIIVWSAAGVKTGYYAVTKLSVTVATDEDQKKVATFTDLTGHLILKREYTETTGVYQDTYYIYNSAGQVNYVVPPKALELMVAANNYSLAQAGVNKLIFQYWYDNQGRVNQKLIPTKGLVNIIYDPLNRPVLVQDAQMATSYKWYYTKYDAKGHPVSSGIYTDPSHYSALAMQTAVTTNATYNTYWFETRNSTAATGYYTNNSFPSANITPLTYVYFDNYDMDMSGTDDYSYTSPGGLITENAQTTATLRGVPTMTRKTTVGNGIAAGTWLVSYTFYDSNGRPIQTKSNNQLTTTVSDSKTNVYDFSGSPIQTKVSKVVAGNTTSVLTTIGYDPMRRINSVDQSYNNATPIRIASYAYNELGQLIKKNLGLVNNGTIPQTLNLNTTYSGTNTFVASQSITLSENFSVPAGSTFSASIQTNYLQAVDYRYNIRGELLSINNSKLSLDNGAGSGYTNDDSNDLFGMQFLYDNVDANIGNTAYYNGNLSVIKWMSKDGSGVSSVERTYKYTYDAVNRYKGESYAERATASTGTFGSNIGGFDENVGLYDSNGNIQTLTRKSSTPGGSPISTIDNLKYTYDTANPNQLTSVADASGNAGGFKGGTGNYAYDAVGNMTADPYKGLGITYNDLNKTNVITVTAGTNQHIDYTYDASGTVIRKQLYYNTNPVATTDYIDGFVYIGSSLSYFPMPEGRVRNTGSSLKPEYIIKDQQGNARISFEESTTAGVPVVRQENSYYGMGMNMTSTMALPTSPNKNLYNGGSEWQNDYGNAPDYYQTLNRNYDAALGRFIAADPMAEATESMGVYQYANNNPVMMNDPEGNYAAVGTVYYQGQLTFGPGFDRKGFKQAWRAVWGEIGEEIFSNDDDYRVGSFYAAYLAPPSSAGGGAGAANTTKVSVNGKSYNYTDAEVDALLDRPSYRNMLPVVPVSAFRLNRLPWWWGDPGASLTGDDHPDENIFSRIWNSRIARWIVPDEVGLNGTLSDVVGVGGNINAKFAMLTRGKDAWKPSLLLSGSFRVGFDIGISATEERGWYNGDARKATLDGLLGDGQDISLGIGPVAAGLWRSLDDQKRATWFGVDEGVGFSPFLLGVSVGQSYTLTPSQFLQKIKSLFP